MAEKVDINDYYVSSTDVVKLLKAFTEMSKLVPDKIAKGASDNVKEMAKVIKNMAKGVLDVFGVLNKMDLNAIKEDIGEVKGDNSTGLAGIFMSFIKLTKPLTDFISNILGIFERLDASSMMKMYVSLQVGMSIFSSLPGIIIKKMSNVKESVKEIADQFTDIIAEIGQKFEFAKDQKENPVKMAVEGLNESFKLFFNIMNDLSNGFLEKSRKIVLLFPLYRLSIRAIKNLISFILSSFTVDEKKQKQFNANAQNVATIFNTFILFSNNLTRTILTAFVINKFKPMIEETVLTISIILLSVSDTIKDLSEKIKSVKVSDVTVVVGNMISFLNETSKNIIKMSINHKKLQSLSDEIKLVFEGISTIIENINLLEKYNINSVKTKIDVISSIVVSVRNVIANMGLLGTIGILAFVPIKLGLGLVKLAFKSIDELFELVGDSKIKESSLDAMKNLTFIGLAIGAIALAIAAITVTGILVLKNIPALLAGLAAFAGSLVAILGIIWLIGKVEGLIGKQIKGTIIELALIIGSLTLIALGLVALSFICSLLTFENLQSILVFLGVLALITVAIAVVGFFAGMITGALAAFAVIPIAILSLIITAGLLILLNTVLVALEELEWKERLSAFTGSLLSVFLDMAVDLTLLALGLPAIILAMGSLFVGIGSLTILSLTLLALDKIISKLKFANINGEVGEKIYSGDFINVKINNLLYTGKQIVQGMNNLFGDKNIFGKIFSSAGAATNSAALIASIMPLFTMAKLLEKLGNLKENVFSDGFNRVAQLMAFFFGGEVIYSLFDNTPRLTNQGNPGIATMVMSVLTEFGKDITFNNSTFGTLNPFASSDQELVSKALTSAFKPLNTMVTLIERLSKIKEKDFKDGYSKVEKLCAYFFGTSAEDSGISGMIMSTLSSVTLNSSGWNPFADSDQEKVVEILTKAMSPLSSMLDIIDKLANGKVQKFDENGNVISGQFVQMNWEEQANRAKDNLSKVIPSFIDICNLLKGGDGNNKGFLGFGKSDFEKTVEMIESSAKPINSMLDIFEKINKMKWNDIKDPLEKFRGIAWRYKDMFKNLNEVAKTNDKKDVAHKEIAKSVDGIVESVNNINDSKADKFVKVMESLTKFSSSWNGSIDKLVDALAGKDGLIVKLTDMNDQLQKVADNKTPAQATAQVQTTAASTNERQKPVEKTDLTQIINQINSMVASLQQIQSRGITIHQDNGEYLAVKNW